eukprot:GFYU01067059.1.p1 GENE.GFYU01067059.1~~GFYU01067059.1.p1  ORF type:complete len:244 (-),score=31.96 GFYU01067059.1:109-840(-)
MVPKALKVLEGPGGIYGCSEMSRGVMTADRVEQQWDFPYGWAPHQILAWEGLKRYGLRKDASRLAYKWLYMICLNSADYNGVIPEKFDIKRCSHEVFAEYGNVSTKFRYITKEGFGWMNASIKLGIKYLTPMKYKALQMLTPSDTVDKPSDSELPLRRLSLQRRDSFDMKSINNSLTSQDGLGGSDSDTQSPGNLKPPRSPNPGGKSPVSPNRPPLNKASSFTYPTNTRPASPTLRPSDVLRS